ncbi:MAG: 50S ribosomal protein L21 [Ignavibacteria bacterium]|nr:50S ribosomal protein L21 [Ignavibacteria bacterium]
MYAVVEIAGKQFKVGQNDKIYVPSLKDKVGAKVKFDRVLLLDDKQKTDVGNPFVAGASIEGRIVEHVKGEKVTVFKKKRRKGYRVKRGHRQRYTQVQITKISK